MRHDDLKNPARAQVARMPCKVLIVGDFFLPTLNADWLGNSIAHLGLCQFLGVSGALNAGRLTGSSTFAKLVKERAAFRVLSAKGENEHLVGAIIHVRARACALLAS